MRETFSERISQPLEALHELSHVLKQLLYEFLEGYVESVSRRNCNPKKALEHPPQPGNLRLGRRNLRRFVGCGR